MNSICIKITADTDGYEIKKIIENRLKLSSSLITKLKKNDGIRLNGESCTVRKTVKCGDILNLTFPAERSLNIPAVNIPLDILYEDDSLLILCKPGNMPVHPTLNNYSNSLACGVMYYYKEFPFVFRAVNRLDKDTTGIVVVAKDPYSAAELGKQMKNKTFKKYYAAITDGIPGEKEGIIDAPIKRCENSIIKREVNKNGQTAVTKYRIDRTNKNHALVKISLLTGRTHQIRVHFAYIKTPLLYDFLYGKEEPGKTFYLHCERCEFIHPVTKKPFSISCPLPEKYREFFPGI